MGKGKIEEVRIVYRVFVAESEEFSWDELREVSSMEEAMVVAEEFWERFGYVYIEAETKYVFSKEEEEE